MRSSGQACLAVVSRVRAPQLAVTSELGANTKRCPAGWNAAIALAACSMSTAELRDEVTQGEVTGQGRVTSPAG
jgi:hypothetical protein